MQESVDVICPYCGEQSNLFIDYSGGTTQTYYEDCPVCCRPWEVHVEIRGEIPSVTVQQS